MDCRQTEAKVTPITAKTLLRDTLAKQLYSHWKAFAPELAMRSIDALQYGYCWDIELLKFIENWNPTLEPSEVRWFNKLKNSVATIQEKIRIQGNLSQININKKLIAFLHKYPQFDSKKLSKYLKDGYCVGYAYVMMASLFQTKHNNRQWVKHVLSTLALWNATDELSTENRKDILTFLRLIHTAQHTGSTLSEPQQDWARVYKDDQDRVLHKSACSIIPLEKLQQLSDELTVKDTKQDIDITRFDIMIHGTYFAKISDEISEFYDSNNLTGEITFNYESKILQTLLKIAHTPPLKNARYCKEIPPTEFIMAMKYSLHSSAKSFKTTMLEEEIKKLSVTQKNLCLDFAIKCDDKHFFQSILPYAKPSEAQHLLEAAVRYNKPYYIPFLLSHKHPANINAKSVQSERTVLHRAAHLGHAEIARILLQNGVKPDAKLAFSSFRDFGHTALHIAVKNGHLDVVEAILEYHPKCIHTLTTRDNCPLWIAIENKHTEIIKFLAARGADLKRLGPNQMRPLNFAIENGDIETARLLMSLGATIQTKPMKITTYDHAAHLRKYRELAREVLYDAIIKKNQKIALNMLECIPDVITPLENGEEFIFVAAKHDCAALIPGFKYAGANINLKGLNGMTPLHVAVDSGNIATVRALILSGAHVNERNAKGLTAIELASSDEMRRAIIHAELEKDKQDFLKSSSRYRLWKQQRIVIAEKLQNIAMGMKDSQLNNKQNAKLQKPKYRTLSEIRDQGRRYGYCK